MKLNRYILLDESRAMPFGKHIRNQTYDFDYYVGNKRLGISSNYSTEADNFLSEFFYNDQKLIVSQSSHNPRLRLETSSIPQMFVRDGRDRKEIVRLVDLLLNSEEVHAFVTTEKTSPDYPTILTFSQKMPPIHKYNNLSSITILLGN